MRGYSAPDFRYLSHVVGEEEGDGEGGDVVQAGRLQDVPYADDDRVPGAVK